MKIDADRIAGTALTLLDRVGLDGLTMRLVATELGVQAPALYWHVKNKQELLDAMAVRVFLAAVDGVESPRRGEDWADWIAELARRLRRAMLGHRDGARVFAGSSIAHPALYRTIELTLRTLTDAGFDTRDAVRAFGTLYHYTVGYTIEEQARIGTAYGDDNPYDPGRFAESVDPQRFPLTTQVLDTLFDPDADAGFEHGLRLIITGMR